MKIATSLPKCFVIAWIVVTCGMAGRTAAVELASAKRYAGTAPAAVVTGDLNDDGVDLMVANSGRGRSAACMGSNKCSIALHSDETVTATLHRTPDFLIAAQVIFVALQTKTAALGPQDETPAQHYVCNTGYTLAKCHKDMTVLRRTLAKYPTALLGNWTWILVRSEDWKAILLPRGLDPDSPAFTFYPKRETFIEEVLVTEVPGRGRELLLKWNMNKRDLLDFAISHELGHAVCNDKNEWNANRVAQLLRDGKAPYCGAELEAKTRTGKIGKPR